MTNSKLRTASQPSGGPEQDGHHRAEAGVWPWLFWKGRAWQTSASQSSLGSCSLLGLAGSLCELSRREHHVTLLHRREGSEAPPSQLGPCTGRLFTCPAAFVSGTCSFTSKLEWSSSLTCGAYRSESDPYILLFQVQSRGQQCQHHPGTLRCRISGCPQTGRIGTFKV